MWRWRKRWQHSVCVDMPVEWRLLRMAPQGVIRDAYGTGLTVPSDGFCGGVGRYKP